MRTSRPVIPDSPPNIRTARLLLRPVQESDLDDYYDMRSNRAVMLNSFSGLVDPDREATSKYIQKFLPPRHENYAFSIFALEGVSDTQDSGMRFVGNVGFYKLDKPSVGYMIRQEDWGKGYATEALRGLLEHYWTLERKTIEVEDDTHEYRQYQTIELDGIVREGLRAMIEVKNTGSKRVLEKCGFRLIEGKEWIPEPDHRGPEKLIWYYVERPLREP
ncbi:GNAT domain-containing protein [Fimicolochytrium jonesii]|uniref:GNAT domain-containing protein n=1 Tax=Fimicolochytrium jonesii TaxID=1396493 RepID=UPI0022FE6563|nr:GNAT domain-containing protein [Fimicolochytrium jonesii]KAI8816223.1 GNAT domain-containing protein [Fimicolochytrium jonesii]